MSEKTPRQSRQSESGSAQAARQSHLFLEFFIRIKAGCPSVEGTAEVSDHHTSRYRRICAHGSFCLRHVRDDLYEYAFWVDLLPSARGAAQCRGQRELTNDEAVCDENPHRFGNKVIERVFALTRNLKVFVDLSDDLIRKGFKDGFGVREVAINGLSCNPSLLRE